VPRKPLHAIVAVAPDGAIGARGRLAWDIPEDTRQFLALTEGGVMIEGPLCYAELGRALPGRGTVVVSRDPSKVFPGAERAATLESAIALASGSPWPGPVWITGGERVYAEGLPWCERLYITRVGLPIEGDRFFPRGWEADFPRVLSRRVSRQGAVPLVFEVRGR
jgi:dihydrofolate reductase